MSGSQAAVCILIILAFAVMSSLAVFEHNSRRHQNAALIWFVLFVKVAIGIAVIIVLGIPPATVFHYS